MLKGKFKFLFIIAISFSFIGGDCSTDDNDPEPPKAVAAPGSINFKVDANPGGGSSYAVISWTPSADENNADFRGYRVVTYVLNASNEISFIFNEQSLVDSIHSYTINSIDRNTKYKSTVQAELTNGTKSDALETPVYGGVYYSTNGSIDSYTQSSNSLSGYGWNIQSGEGIQYIYTQTNSNLIDIHLRLTTGATQDSNLYFFSPDVFAGSFKSSKIDLVGIGQEAFDKSELKEPDRPSYIVTDESVYLLKTEEGNYIKIWVKDIDEVGSQYFNVKFEYKVQPIQDLRIVKR
jgi:hypothetical protein